MEYEVVLLEGPWDGRTFDLEWPPPDALLYAGEPYMWGDTTDKNERPIYIHNPEIPHRDCRVVNGRYRSRYP